MRRIAISAGLAGLLTVAVACGVAASQDSPDAPPTVPRSIHTSVPGGSTNSQTDLAPTETPPAALPPEPTGAPLTGPLVVDSIADAVDSSPGDGICDDGTGSCTLRAAVMEANATPEAAVIELPAGLYEFPFLDDEHAQNPDENDAAVADLDVFGDVTIEGAGSEVTELEGGSHRLFHVHPSSSLTLSGVTVRNFWSKEGGAIYNDGVADASDVYFEANSAETGGAIYNNGTLTLNRVTMEKQRAADGSGIFNAADGQLEFIDGLMVGQANHPDMGILNRGQATLIGVAIMGHRNTANGAAILNTGDLTMTGGGVINNWAGRGGGIYTDFGSVTLNDVQISGNLAVSPRGPVRSVANGGGIYVAGGTLTMNGGAIVGNFAGNSGGGLHHVVPVTLEDVDILDNQSGVSGGGIFSDGDLTFTNGALSRNCVAIPDVIVGRYQDPAEPAGGALYANSGLSTLTGVEISGNESVGASNDIHIAGGEVELTDSPISEDGSVCDPEREIG